MKYFFKTFETTEDELELRNNKASHHLFETKS
jgi:hypothetical protein